ncbi:MAG: RDD family protein [Thermoleophilaceae bacterium]
MESGSGRDESSEGPQSPASPQSPANPEALASPQPSASPERPASESPAGSSQTPGYGGPVPPGGWTQPVTGPPAAPVVAPGQLAGWGRRLGATVLDGLIILIPALAIMGVLGIGVVGAITGDSDLGLFAIIGAIIVTVLVFVVISFVYAPLMMMRGGEHNGQTLGKQMLGIRVVRTSGEPMDFLWAALREVAIKNFAVGLVSSFTLGIATLVNYLWPLWDDQNRALHDFAASTRVVSAT